jgi:hypothetical protein
VGMQIRDDRQMKALTGLSQAQFDSLLPVFRDIYQATQQQAYKEGVESGTRRRKPGGGSKGKLPTLAEKLLFVLYQNMAEDHTCKGVGECHPYREFEGMQPSR